MPAAPARWAFTTLCLLSLAGCQGAGGGWKLPWRSASTPPPQYSNWSGSPPAAPGSQLPSSTAVPGTAGTVSGRGLAQQPAGGYAGSAASFNAAPGGAPPAWNGSGYPTAQAGAPAGANSSPGMGRQVTPGNYDFSQPAAGGRGAAAPAYTADTRSGDPFVQRDRYPTGSRYDSGAGAPEPSANEQYAGGTGRYASEQDRYAPAGQADASSRGRYLPSESYPEDAALGPTAEGDGSWNDAPNGTANGYPATEDTREDERYIPGDTGYRPGDTGYSPDRVPPYRSPAPEYDSPGDPAADPHYRPGSTGDYTPGGSAEMPASRYRSNYSGTDRVQPASYESPPSVAPRGNGNDESSSNREPAYRADRRDDATSRYDIQR